MSETLREKVISVIPNHLDAYTKTASEQPDNSLVNHEQHECSHHIHSIWMSCMIGNYEAVIAEIQSGFDVQSKNEDGLTLLHVAVYLGDIEGVKILLALNADPTALDAAGVSPFTISRISGDDEIVNLMTKAVNLIF